MPSLALNEVSVPVCRLRTTTDPTCLSVSFPANVTNRGSDASLSALRACAPSVTSYGKVRVTVRPLSSVTLQMT